MFSAFAEDAHASTRFHPFHHGSFFPPWSIRVARPRARGRGAAATGACALRRDAPTRAARGENTRKGASRPNGLPVGDSRQCGASTEHATAVRASVPSGARGAAVAYAEAWETVFLERTKAQRQSSGGDEDGRGDQFLRLHVHNAMLTSPRPTIVMPSMYCRRSPYDSRMILSTPLPGCGVAALTPEPHPA